MLYEGKAKQVYKTEHPDELIIRFKDEATAFNAQKKAKFTLKGQMNNFITALIYGYLSRNGVPTHFIRTINEREQLVKKVKVFPIEIIVRNFSAGSIVKRLDVKEGTLFSSPIFEICYKNDRLGDPLINDYHAVSLEIITKNELNKVYYFASKINELLIDLFDKVDLMLIDFKIEMGKTAKGEIILVDEISPDSCRLWDKNTMERFDKDLFRLDLGELTKAYVEVHTRLKKLFEISNNEGS